MLSILKDNNTCSLQLSFHNVNDTIVKYKTTFFEYINYIEKQQFSNIFKFLNNKHILIVNNLGSLIKQQFESGNLKKIHPEFPDNIKSLQYLENTCTFFNNGPDSNILETANNICNQIKEFNFDGAVISTGAYSCIIADYILNNLKKEVYVIGGDLGYYFGISNKRAKHFNSSK